MAGIQDGLAKTFPDTTATVIKELLPIPEHAFDKKRNQYNSNIILNEVRAYAAKTPDFHRVLGVVDVDIFTFGLNYVFGEAYTPGNAALISLWRLKPEFYKDKPDLATLLVAGAQRGSSRSRTHVGCSALSAVAVCYAFFQLYF